MQSAFRLLLTIYLICPGIAGGQARENKISPIYIDKAGTFRWTKDNREAAFFGVNYTTPFAHAYRAHKILGINPEDAIRQDVYHMARLGLNAFRVHVWDTEVSDVEGNLLNNEHLKLYDFLLAELKKRNIKTIITPIAFWGNGYPERDQETPGFSAFFGRGKLTTNESAIAAQENFLKQFFTHVNPYTKLSYQDDPDVIAVEINNEPAHSGAKEGVTRYVNRLTSAIRSTGWVKPVFYNISQSPFYADAVAASQVDGFSFQWYPTGLVSGKALTGNYLPHVDKYPIPFDTIPAFRNKGLMVYEFDAADILQSYMYPAMARSFREAGMGWATQFAYDPMAMANVNTEYQTHYLNLAFTPSKAISMLIAARVFYRLPRFKHYGAYPTDSVFDLFRVSCRQALSEMNDEKEFIYSNSTDTQPVSPGKLLRVAGVGNSPVVKYDGSGAYFLDKLEDGVWRLEVMPDVIHIRDPFEKASPRREVAHIEWKPNKMQIALGLGDDFQVKGLNTGNSYTAVAVNQAFKITPGTYFIFRKGKQPAQENYKAGVIGLAEFVAPPASKKPVSLYHVPFREVSANRSFTLRAFVTGLDSGSVSAILSPLNSRSKTLNMTKSSDNEYKMIVSEDLLQPGVLSYRIITKQGNDYTVFPGGIKEDPFSWDSHEGETWRTSISGASWPLELFNPTHDRAVRTYPNRREGFEAAFTVGEASGQIVLKLHAADLVGVKMLGLQCTFVDALRGRTSELTEFNTIVVRARSSRDQPADATVTLVNQFGQAFSAAIKVTNQFRNIEVPLHDFLPGKSLLLPRPYPSFLPLTFDSGTGRFDIRQIERIEITTGYSFTEAEKQNPFSFEVARVGLEK